MTDDTINKIDPVKRPDLQKLNKESPEVADYIGWLEERVDLQEQELQAKPGAQARGIFWVDLFGTVPHPYQPDLRLQVKGNFTERSDVGALHATRLAFNSLRAIRAEFNLAPWIPQVPPSNGKPKAPAQPAEAKEAQPSGRTRRRQSEPTGSKTKTPEPLGDHEQWYKVKSLDLGQNQDKTEKVLYVRCGRWHKHGVSAYLDSANIPEDVLTMIEEGAWSVEDQPVQGKELEEDFPDMHYALIATDPDGHNKVVGFSNQPPA